MNLDEIKNQLRTIDPEFYSEDPKEYSEYKFFGYHVLDNNHKLFWNFFETAYDDLEDDEKVSLIVEEISDEPDWIRRIILSPRDHGFDVYDGFKQDEHSEIFLDLATQISFIMAMFKYGGIKESVQYLLCGLKKDCSIKVVILSVNSETMTFKELK